MIIYLVANTIHFERVGRDIVSGTSENASKIRLKFSRLMRELKIKLYWYGNTSDLERQIMKQESNLIPGSSCNTPDLI